MDQKSTGEFYDHHWTQTLPQYNECKKHLESFFEKKEIESKKILDAGCGTGVFSVIMGEMGAEKVVGIDISDGSLETARKLSKKKNLGNCEFQRKNMLDLPYDDNEFDIVWAWGSVHHTEDPMQAISELLRVLKPGGSILLAVYKKTKLTPIHNAIRKTLIRTPRQWWSPISKLLAIMLHPIVAIFKKQEKHRKGETLAELIEDWYFVPIRHHYYPKEIKIVLESHGFTIEKYLPSSGRFESTSNFIYKARDNS